MKGGRKMEIKKGTLVIVKKPLGGLIGLVTGEVPRDMVGGTISYKDKQWIVIDKEFREGTFLTDDLVPLLQIPEEEQSLPVKEIIEKHKTELMEILASQIIALTNRIEEIYNRLRNILAKYK